MPWDSWEALHTIARTLPRVAVFTVAAFSAIYLSERLTGAPTVQYRTRGFRHDLVYWFYYLSGVHNLVFTSALFAALTPRLAVFDLKLLEGMHPIPRYVCYWVVVDFMAYWFHRWKHSSRFLWAFHAVHHSQEQLSAPTLVRGHPLEQFIGQVLFFAPLLALGAPPAAWLPIAFLRTFLESSQHSALGWRFGPFY
ncbi:MAG: sterol desaturase family protein, partial [Acidobacteria bacterium]|nr:sterol desaturase family protein [Acidobacteriota bacterium]